MADTATLLSWAEAIRKRKESAGFELDGMPIETDPESRAVLTDKYVQAKQNPEFNIPNWKVTPGVYVPLSNEAIIAAGDAVTAYIQACFDRNREIDELILSGAITTREQIVAAFEEMI